MNIPSWVKCKNKIKKLKKINYSIALTKKKKILKLLLVINFSVKVVFIQAIIFFFPGLTCINQIV